MGVRLILLLGMLTGVLYCVHLLAQDYQTISTGGKLLRFLFKRDLSRTNQTKPTVHWKKIIHHDPIQCARYLYCDLGTRAPQNDLQKGFIYMLTIEPLEEDRPSLQEFKRAYKLGRLYGNKDSCKKLYNLCPFDASFLFRLIRFLLPT